MNPINAKQSREQSSTHSRGRGAGFGILLTLLLSSAAAFTSYWTWQQSNLRDEIQGELEGGISQLLTSMEKQRETIDRRFSAQQNHQHELLQQRIAALEAKFAQAEQPIRVDRWSVAEAIYLINIAEHHYRLEQNSEIALAALLQARSQLLEHRSPELLPALEQISAIIAQLESENPRNSGGQIAQLSQLLTLIPELPRAHPNYEMQIDTPNTSYSLQSVEGWRQYGSALWHDIQQLFRISRPGDSKRMKERPVTDDIYPILRQQLALKVEFARLAMLSHSPLYVDTLREVVALLKRYYDRDSAEVKDAVARLEQIIAAAAVTTPTLDFGAIRQQLTASGNR